jgi:hypothetical protein
MKGTHVIRNIISWLAVLVGLCVSAVSFGMFGMLPLTGAYGPPSWQTWIAAVTFLCWGTAVAAASLIAFRNRKISSLLCLIAAPLVTLGAWVSQMSVSDALVPIFPAQHSTPASMAIAFSPLIMLGYFWSIAHRYHWPHLAVGTELPRWAKVVLASTVIAVFLVCVCAVSVRIVQLETDFIDCGGPSPFFKPYRHHAVFVARVVHFDQITGAMAIVQERFGGIPRWNKVVFLKYVQKGTWFVDGRVEDGIITRWLVPVLDLKCTGSAPIQDAGVELRLFRGSSDWGGVRIIGRVLQPPGKGWTPASGTTVVIDGPRGSVTTFTDRDGIYDVTGLPSGHYSIRLPSSQRHGTCEDFREAALKAGDVWGCDLFADSSQ